MTDFIAGTSLYRLLRTQIPPRDAVEQLARQVADIWQQLDELCVWHNDFKPENLLVDPAGKVWLIDFEKLRRFRDRAAARRRQVRDAAMLLHPRNWRRAPWAAEVFRQAILQTRAATETLAGPLSCGHPLCRAAPAANEATQLVTVLIPCGKRTDDPGPCIESVRDLADEIIVAAAVPLDDAAITRYQRPGCRVIWRDGDDRLDFEAWALRQAHFSWVLRLLPGERVDAELSKRIQDVVASEPGVDAYRIPRCATFCGQRLRHGSVLHDAPVRLFRKNSVELVQCDGEVDVVARPNRVGKLPVALWRELNAGCGAYVQSIVEGASTAARLEHRRLPRPSWGRVLASAVWRFAQSFLVHRGFQDGWPGLHVACLEAWGAYMRAAMHWELAQETEATPVAERSVLPALKLFDPSRGGGLPGPPVAEAPAVGAASSVSDTTEAAARKAA